MEQSARGLAHLLTLLTLFLLTFIFGGSGQIASGSDHVVAATAGGEVLSWGCGEKGRLGRFDRDLKAEARSHQIPSDPIRHLIRYPRSDILTRSDILIRYRFLS